MSIFFVLGISIIGTAMSLLLKKYLPEYSIFVVLLTSVAILFWITVNILPVIDKIDGFLSDLRVPNEYIVIVFKCLGITFLVQVVSDICKDAGETAISSKLEMAGKVLILVISLPLFEKIISMVFQMLRKNIK